MILHLMYNFTDIKNFVINYPMMSQQNEGRTISYVCRQCSWTFRTLTPSLSVYTSLMSSPVQSCFYMSYKLRKVGGLTTRVKCNQCKLINTFHTPYLLRNKLGGCGVGHVH